MKTWQPKLPPYKNYKKQVYLQHAKTARFIYQLGEGDTIRQKSQEVAIDKITFPETKQKIAYLKKCLFTYRKITGVGRGIAAIQVGIQERFSVIYLRESQSVMIIINPVITKKAKELYMFPEGCMSEGPIFASVKRPAWIEFTYYDEQGNKKFWDTKGEDTLSLVYNRVFQHEIDHMNGIIFLDKAIQETLTLESDPTFYDKATFTKVKENA